MGFPMTRLLSALIEFASELKVLALYMTGRILN